MTDGGTRDFLAKHVLEALLATPGVEVEDAPVDVQGPLGGFSSQVIGTYEHRRFVVCVYCDDKTQEA